MEIIHFSAECYPVAKVGGLGDVVGALPKYLNKAGEAAKVVMPCYDTKFIHAHDWELQYKSRLKLGNQVFDFSVLKEKEDVLGFELYMIRIPELIEGPVIYTGLFDTERFIAFQIAALQWICSLEALPEVMHCHDHHTGLIPFMMRHCAIFEKLKDIPSVFTIHSGQYQGQCSWEKQGLIPDYDPWNWGLLDWNGFINPMASAIKCSWMFTTVSGGYLQELQSQAMGLESLIRDEHLKSIGIINGIDTEIWNPQTDKEILFNYTVKTIDKQKSKNKEELCRTFGLDPEKPLTAFIGRLVNEKGADLLPEAIVRNVHETNGAMNFILLGSGSESIENDLKAIKEVCQGHYNCYIGYNEKLSHLIYAGADFLIMPSRVEPCGLNQLYALRYGTIPAVRSTGGLKDTVLDYSEKNGFGIRFENASVYDIYDAFRRCKELFDDQVKFLSLRKKIMRIEHSWEKSAGAYLGLYNNLKQV